MNNSWPWRAYPTAIMELCVCVSGRRMLGDDWQLVLCSVTVSANEAVSKKVIGEERDARWSCLYLSSILLSTNRRHFKAPIGFSTAINFHLVVTRFLLLLLTAEEDGEEIQEATVSLAAATEISMGVAVEEEPKTPLTAFLSSWVPLDRVQLNTAAHPG